MENRPEDNSRTPYCKHTSSCAKSILIDTPKIAASTYLIKAGLTLLFSLKKIIKKPAELLKIFAGKDAIRFGLFVGTFVGLFRTTMCTLRRYIK